MSLIINGSHVEIDNTVHGTLAEVVQGFGGDQLAPTPCWSATCGACTVLLNETPVLSCITQAALCDHTRITTATVLAQDMRLAALGNLFADPLIQACGVCRSGLLASAAALLDANPRPTREDARHALAGHACLCIGYGAFLAAVTAHGTVIPLAPSVMQQPERLPSHEDIAQALAQERRVADKGIDPLGPISAMLGRRAKANALNDAAAAFGWSRESSGGETRQLSGSWVAVQGTVYHAAIVFVALEVDSETKMVSLRRVVTLLIGVTGRFDAAAEAGVMRGIFLALRPGADTAEQLFPAGYPTSIDLPEVIHLTLADGTAPRTPPGEVRRDVCLATVRAIAGAIHDASGIFPERAPYAPPWAQQPDLDNTSNIS